MARLIIITKTFPNIISSFFVNVTCSLVMVTCANFKLMDPLPISLQVLFGPVMCKQCHVIIFGHQMLISKFGL